MNRRDFFGVGALGGTGFLAGCAGGETTCPPCPGEPERSQLAGMTLVELREYLDRELFGVYLPFWRKYGYDSEFGGFICSLDYDGTPANTSKQMWFQGRGIWVFSFLYNHFGKDPRHLEVAKKTRDFVLKNGPQPDGWWAESLTREGTVNKPFEGDIYGMYFVAEGLQEYARASGDEGALNTALDLIKKLYRHINDPSSRFPGTGQPGQRPQGLWMVNLRIATQILRQRDDPEIAAIADRCIDAIVARHYNPDIGLNNEVLDFDFGRPQTEQTKCLLGHSVETLWMVMDEAARRNDDALWELCATRIRRHLEVGWDPVFGGFCQWVNVDQGGYEWPVEHPVGTDLEFGATGEYHYMKPLWALNEIQIATLEIFRRSGADWAAQFFSMAEEVTEQKYRKKAYNLPGYMLFADRRMNHQPRVARQDNYHPARQLMLNLIALDQMLGQEKS